MEAWGKMRRKTRKKRDFFTAKPRCPGAVPGCEKMLLVKITRLLQIEMFEIPKNIEKCINRRYSGKSWMEKTGMLCKILKMWDRVVIALTKNERRVNIMR